MKMFWRTNSYIIDVDPELYSVLKEAALKA